LKYADRFYEIKRVLFFTRVNNTLEYNLIPKLSSLRSVVDKMVPEV